MINRIFNILALTLLLAGSTYAQQSEIYTDENADYRNGVELFDKEKFGAAREQFAQVMERIKDPNDEIRVNAEYYHALSALELFNRDAEHLLAEFIRHHPESPKIQSAYFQLGRYYYRRKKFDDALEWFEKVDEYKLSNDELAEFYFKKGYSHFREGDMDQADKYFYQIREAESDYRDAALYYHSHIQYEKKNYQTALQGFEQLQTHKSFGRVVPYYITQIYFLQKKYDDLIDYASPLIDTANVKREGEIARMIGEAYFQKKDYENSIPFLEKYRRRGVGVTRDDHYMLGYAYYQTGNWDKAIEHFNLVTGIKDPMTQLAYYHIADSYLNKEDKTASRAAFREASKLTFDPEVKENALYNYAKLSYELSYNPYHEAIIAFEEYIDTYPNSPRKEEAYNYLINVYMTTNNYQKALESLDQIPNKDMRQKTAYQLVAFNSGVELFSNLQYKEAIAAFRKVNTYPIDRNITNQSIYWTGESYYRLAEYENAIVQFKKFQARPEAYLSPLYAVADYNIGYAYIKKKQYENAITWFRKFAQDYKDENLKKLNDAYLRIGDAYFVRKPGAYNDAIFYYDKAIDIRLVNTDYALFQKAMCLGYLGKKQEKISVLKSMVSDFPESPQLMEGKFELAEAYRVNGQTSEALNYYNQVVTEFPNSPKVKQALLQTAVIYYQSGRNNDAITVLKRIANESSSLPEADPALRYLRGIYSDMGDPQAYIAFVQTLPYYNANPQELDTLHFDAGKELYFAGKYQESVSAFNEYLTKFNRPIFEVDARFYRAMSNVKLEKDAAALPDLDFIVGLPSNLFTEDALLYSARIHFKRDNYQAALPNYMSLEKVSQLPDRVMEAQIGQMRCFHRLGNCEAAIDYADKIIKNDKTKEKVWVEAHMTKGYCFYQNGEKALAFKAFEKVSDKSKTEKGAEAHYHLALIRHEQGRYDESDKQVQAMIRRVPSYDHWVAMGFLVLAENAIAVEDYFQAKATLQSIIDNHDGAEVVRKAQARLDWVIEQENKAEGKSMIREDFDVQMDGALPGQEDLFNDDPDKPKEKRKDRKPDGNQEPGSENNNDNPEKE